MWPWQYYWFPRIYPTHFITVTIHCCYCSSSECSLKIIVVWAFTHWSYQLFLDRVRTLPNALCVERGHLVRITYASGVVQLLIEIKCVIIAFLWLAGKTLTFYIEAVCFHYKVVSSTDSILKVVIDMLVSCSDPTCISTFQRWTWDAELQNKILLEMWGSSEIAKKWFITYLSFQFFL